MNSCIKCNSQNVTHQKDILCINTSHWSTPSEEQNAWKGSKNCNIFESYVKWNINLCDNCLYTNFYQSVVKERNSAYLTGLGFFILAIGIYFLKLFLTSQGIGKFFQLIFTFIAPIFMIIAIVALIYGIILSIRAKSMSFDKFMLTEEKLKSAFINQGEELIKSINSKKNSQFELPKPILKEKLQPVSNMLNLVKSDDYQIKLIPNLTSYLWNINYRININKSFLIEALTNYKNYIDFFKNENKTDEAIKFANNEFELIEKYIEKVSKLSDYEIKDNNNSILNNDSNAVEEVCVVTDEKLIVYNKTHENLGVLSELEIGEKFNIDTHADFDRFFKIILPSGKIGYILKTSKFSK